MHGNPLPVPMPTVLKVAGLSIPTMFGIFWPPQTCIARKLETDLVLVFPGILVELSHDQQRSLSVIRCVVHGRAFANPPVCASIPCVPRNRTRTRNTTHFCQNTPVRPEMLPLDFSLELLDS